jgi:phosphatidylserine decarboxylase
MRTPARAALSRVVGWIADRRVPRPLRAPLYKGYARATGADLSEVASPLASHESLGEFFVRRLRDGARPIDAGADAIVSPCDGTLQASCAIERGSLIQAKGRPYALEDLLGSSPDAEACEAGTRGRSASPRATTTVSMRRRPPTSPICAGSRRAVLGRAGRARREARAPVNERAVFRLETARGTLGW